MGMLRAFDSYWGKLPPAVMVDKGGKVYGSWRFALMPFCGLEQLPEWDLRETWDSPANRELRNTRLELFCFQASEDSPRNLETNVVAITGPDTTFDGIQRRRLGDLPPNLVLAIDVADSGIPWMSAGDIDIRHVPDSITQGVSGSGVHVLFADGEVWHLRKDVPLSVLKAFFTICTFWKLIDISWPDPSGDGPVGGFCVAAAGRRHALIIRAA